MDHVNCLNCGKALSGRVDKKFCDTPCRASFNNKHKRKSERMISAINRQIRKNRAILKTLCPEGKSKVRRARLEEMGFSFAYFSSLYRSAGLTYYFSYEYGYAPIVEKSSRGDGTVQKVLIIQSQDFMKDSFDPWKTY